MSAEGRCANCGSAHARVKYVTRSYGKGKELLVIERIPMWSCPACGESYFTARTMHEIDRMKALRKTIAKERAVPVAVYEMSEALP